MVCVQYRGHFLQLKPQNRRYGPTQSKAMICEWEDGAVEVRTTGMNASTYEDLVLRPSVVTDSKGRAAAANLPSTEEASLPRTIRGGKAMRKEESSCC